jgi:hypothetical protein
MALNAKKDAEGSDAEDSSLLRRSSSSRFVVEVAAMQNLISAYSKNFVDRSSATGGSGRFRPHAG